MDYDYDFLKISNTLINIFEIKNMIYASLVYKCENYIRIIYLK